MGRPITPIRMMGGMVGMVPVMRAVPVVRVVAAAVAAIEVSADKIAGRGACWNRAGQEDRNAEEDGNEFHKSVNCPARRSAGRFHSPKLLAIVFRQAEIRHRSRRLLMGQPPAFHFEG